MQEPSFTDIEVLATILQHTEAVVVNAGTVLLDALVNDRPAVCVLYDEGAPPGESWAAKSVIGEHYRDVAVSGAFHEARSFEEVTTGIERCLASPGELEAERRAVTATVVGPVDGQSAERVVEAILERHRRMSASRLGRASGSGGARETPTGAGRCSSNDWYSHAVGHVIEALRHCQGYHACDPELRHRARPEPRIADRARRVRPVRLGGVRRPVHELRHADRQPEAGAAGASRATGTTSSTIRPRPTPRSSASRVSAATTTLRGATSAAGCAVGVAGLPPPAYEPHQRLRLDLPEPERERARQELGGRRTIAVMPAGSGARYLYPSTTSWLEILDELERRFPDAVFAFVGRLDDSGGRTSSGFTRGEVDRLLASREGTIDAFDRPILEQLAIVEASILFVSPHTGFGFTAVAVDTPWLTLSGGDWPEYFFNGVPFHSVLPKSRDVPAFVHSRTLPMIDADEDGGGPAVGDDERPAGSRRPRGARRGRRDPRRRAAVLRGRARRLLPPPARGLRRRPLADPKLRGRPRRLRLGSRS